MKHAHFKYFRSATAALGMVLIAGSAYAQQGLAAAPVQLAQNADCYAVGQRVAAERGGTLARASAESRGGQTVCRIVVLVPGQNGERPRRAEIIVPAR